MPDKAAYQAALQAGQALVAEQSFPDAVARFEAALKAMPGDARALSELGWAAFRAGDLGKSRSASERAVAAAQEPPLRAASRYNLGRVLEAQGDTKAAIAQYRRSLQERQSKAVRQRLASLGGDTKVGMAPEISAHYGNPSYVSCRQPRPFARVCPCLIGDEEEDGTAVDNSDWADELPRDTCAWVAGKDTDTHGLVRHGKDTGAVYLLARKTDRGWAILRDLHEAVDNMHESASFSLQGMSEKTLGPARIVRIDYETESASHYTQYEYSVTSRSRHALICVLDGPSGLSCSLDAMLSCEYEIEPEGRAGPKASKGSSSAELTLSPDGLATLAKVRNAKGGKRSPCRIAPRRVRLW